MPRASVWADPAGTATYPKDLADAIAVSTKNGVGHDRPQVVKVAEAREIVGSPIVDAITGSDAGCRGGHGAATPSRSSWTTRSKHRALADGRGDRPPAARPSSSPPTPVNHAELTSPRT